MANISVIIPVYNHAHTLEQSLRTLEKQTIQVKEVIIVNDGSKDNFNEVIENIVATFVETEPGEFLKMVDDNRFETKVLIQDLISAGIIHKQGHYYKNGDDIMGTSLDEVSDYLTDDKNQIMLVALKKRVKKGK